jgi:hypothetical protein
MDEIKLLQRIADTNRESPGFHHAIEMVDNFTVTGPHGIRKILLKMI